MCALLQAVQPVTCVPTSLMLCKCLHYSVAEPGPASTGASSSSSSSSDSRKAKSDLAAREEDDVVLVKRAMRSRTKGLLGSGN